MTAQELYKAGKLNDAIQALTGELRQNPTDTKRRTFLFELLCFAGEFERAEKQLESLSHEGKNAELGALLYRSALHAERMRQDMFVKGTFPKPIQSAAASESVSGTINGRPFSTLEDCDPRIGANLELYAAGSYVWLPFSLLRRVEMQAPKRLRDLLWAPIRVRPSESYKGSELGEVFCPVLTPGSWRHSDDAVRLGRMTLWEDLNSGEKAPYGQKVWLVDGEEFPILELRQLEIQSSAAAA
jgi:type VI secretion system protein ImpE